eukprot:gene8373-9227_t
MEGEDQQKVISSPNGGVEEASMPRKKLLDLKPLSSSRKAPAAQSTTTATSNRSTTVISSGDREDNQSVTTPHDHHDNNSNNNNNNNNHPRDNTGKQQEEDVDHDTVAVWQKEDPRIHNGKKDRAKSRGQGRNTESFDPASTLVRPDLRILIGGKEGLGQRLLKHDDVVIVPNFFCEADDWSLYNTLIKEMRAAQADGLKDSQWISWHEGAHLISKNPTGSPTYQKIIDRMREYFHIKNASAGTRFNWYKDVDDWKPFHHDSAAFNAERAKNQNITVGVSFGATRELAFLHAHNNTKVYFPQVNGALFSFGRDANISWKHGVNALTEEERAIEQAHGEPLCEEGIPVGRISIILWGQCERVQEEEGSPPMLSGGQGHHMHNPNYQRRPRSRDRRVEDRRQFRQDERRPESLSGGRRDHRGSSPPPKGAYDRQQQRPQRGDSRDRGRESRDRKRDRSWDRSAASQGTAGDRHQRPANNQHEQEQQTWKRRN